MMSLLAWVEATAFSEWMRASGPAFFSSLVLHSIAMAFIAGVHVATDLRILGAAPGVPLSLMRRFFPVLWISLGLVVLSGVLLLIAYPAKALTNPVFYFKLGTVIGALLIMRSQTHQLLTDADAVRSGAALTTKIRLLAMLSLLLWVGAITSGRLLAYTHRVMLASHVL